MDPSLSVWVIDFDPSVAPGLPAVLGERSRVDPAGTIYFKVGPLDTDWSLTPGGGVGIVTAVSATLPLTSSGGTTPDIALNYDGITLTLAAATTLQRAALSGDISAPAGSNTTTLATVNANVGSFTYSSITVNAKGLITAAASGTAPAPANATYITQTPDATLTNEQALSALATGVMQSTTATGVVSTFAVGTGLIPYGNGASLLATTSTFGFNAGNSTLAIGIAPASANANMRLHINGTVVGGVNALIQNQSAASAAFGSLVFLSDTGRGDVYFTSSTYGTGDSLPNSLTFGCTASVIFSPAYGRVLTLTGTDSIFEAGDLILDAGAQFIDKQGTGDLGIGTDGAQNLNLYTNDTDWVIISSAGEVGVTTGATQTWYNLGVPGSANSELVKAYWSSNTWNLENQVTGTGTLRPMVIDSNTAEMGLFGTGIMVLPGATFAFRNLGAIGAATYEQVRSFWTSNTWVLASESAGGTVRNMVIQSDTATLTLSGGGGATLVGGASGSAPSVTANGVAVTVTPVGITSASAAGATLNAVNVTAQTVTITGSTNITTATGFNYVVINRPTYNGTGGAKTISLAATLYLANAPLASGDVTITNPYTVWVDAGLSRFDGNGTHVFELPADATANAASYIGRIPVLIAGTTRYLRYHSD